MRKLALAGVVLVLGCGGGGSSNKSAGTVDPASLDFCIDYGNGVCRLAYLCTDTTTQDAAFHSRYGTSLDDCWQGIQKLCTSNQSGSNAFGPSCGPGKQVSSASATACTDGLQSQTCDEWAVTPAGIDCQAVCSGAGTGGTGTGTGGTGTGTGGTGTGTGGTGTGTGGTGTGTGGTGTAGTGTGSGGSGTSSVSSHQAFCKTGGELQCDRAFECDPAGSASTFGNLAGCKAFIDAACTAGDPCPSSFDATSGAACIAATKTATCTDLMGPAPAVCDSACQ